MNEDSNGAISVEQAADMMAKRREPEGQPNAEDIAEDQAEPETQEVEEVEDTQEVDEDQTEDIADDEEAEETEQEDTELYYEIDGEEVSASQLKEWKKNGMLEADYTRKRQADAEARKALDAEVSKTQQLRTQLQDALATFAIGDEQEPNWRELNQQLSPQEFNDAQLEWRNKQVQKQQAAQAYQQLQAQQREEIIAHERAAILDHFPAWADPQVFEQALPKLATEAESFGFQPDEFANVTDHRMYRVLNELSTLRAKVREFEEAKGAISKRVVKARPKLAPGSKPAKNQGQRKEVQQSRDRLKKTGSTTDAVALLQARRKA